MKITRDNYEVVFIDYFDGSLDAAAVAELRAFLDVNPDLKAEFESFSAQPLVAGDFVFENKASLKRDVITEHNIQSFLNAEVNRDLSAAEQQELNKFLSNNPQFQQDREFYSKAILHPDMSVVFPDKKKLKQPVPFAFNSAIVRYAIAAMLLLSLLAGSVYLFNKSANKSERHVAEASSIPSVNNVDTAMQSEPINSESNSDFKENAVNSNLIQKPLKNIAAASENDNAAAGSSINKKSVQQGSQPMAQKVIQTEQVFADNQKENTIEMVPVLSAALQTGQHAQQPVLNTMTSTIAETANINNTPEYLTVWEALRKAGDANIRKITSPKNETLALANESGAEKISVRDVVEQGIEKISGDKIRLDADKSEQRNSFRFAIGNFRIEKN
jgi:hypothetical protein